MRHTPSGRDLPRKAFILLASIHLLAACAGNGALPAPTPTTMPSATAVSSPTPAPSATVAPSTTATTVPTMTPTAANTATGTALVTVTPTASASAAATASATSTAASTPTATPTSSDTSQIDLLPPAVSAQVDSLVAAIMANQHIPGLSVAIAQNGHTVLAKGYGLAACATSACTSGTSVAADTPFELGSVTKAFTSVGLLLILDNPNLNTSSLGTLDLDAPISQYLATDPNFTLSSMWDNITTRELLSMSSGIRDFGSNTEPWYSILDTIGADPLIFPPGTGYCYSNPGFMTVGAIIQQLTNTAYNQFMATNLFTPLGMTDSLIHTTDNTPPNLATGYAFDSGSGTWSVPTPRSPLSSFSAGAIISTAVDLGTFMSALQSRTGLNPATYTLMWTNVTLQDPTRPGDWGFGWSVANVGDYLIARKDGGLPGITSQVSLYDQMLASPTQIGVAIASNEDSVAGYVTLTADIAGTVNGTPVPNPASAGDGCTPTPCFNCPTPTPTAS
jgi:CubicO group peptidase (beta-lactamase class C family)